ncbi:hypothetical protein M422DRAFT_774880 [Sphaerobolus stellatus SS14]|nr:hypothetical protein M422DRAFT_774880 [Sphaerobolus stellatus SS14]
MSDALVYNIPAWSKDVDPLFASDRSMLYPESDFYASRRMSDSALTADTSTTMTDPNSPATEPDASTPPQDPSRKPSLPGIGAFTPLLDPSETNFARRGSLPNIHGERALGRPTFRPQLSGYAFPAGPGTPPLDNYNSLNSASSTVTSFPSPSTFGSPLSAIEPASYQNESPQQSYTPTLPEPTPVSPQGSPKRRRSPATPPSTSAPAPASAPTNADGQPVRRPRGKLPKHTTDLLKEWLHAHSDHPYPSEDEKRELCARTKLSMSQVSNWMINARRRILAPAKPPAVSATTTEPYRGMARPIGSLYHPPHMYPPSSMVRRPEDQLRLYDAAPYGSPYDPSPRYQAQHMYPVGAPDRRLAYPTSTVGYGHMADYGGSYAPHAGHSPLYMPGSQPRDTTPRYFANPTDPTLQ